MTPAHQPIGYPLDRHQQDNILQNEADLPRHPRPRRADPPRATIGGIDFEDHRIGFDTFSEVCGNQTFKSIPVLEVDGEVMSESGAMLRYAGQKSGLYPADAMDAFKVDMVVDALNDPMNKGFAAAFVGDKEAARAANLSTTVPRYFGGIEKFYAKTTGPFLLGEKMTIADLKVMTVYRMLAEESMFKIGGPDVFSARTRASRRRRRLCLSTPRSPRGSRRIRSNNNRSSRFRG